MVKGSEAITPKKEWELSLKDLKDTDEGKLRLENIIATANIPKALL